MTGKFMKLSFCVNEYKMYSYTQMDLVSYNSNKVNITIKKKKRKKNQFALTFCPALAVVLVAKFKFRVDRIFDEWEREDMW